MKFTEETLEQAVIELFEAEQIPHCNGMFVHKEISDVLLHEDLKQFLLNKYAGDDITLNEINSIIRKLELFLRAIFFFLPENMIENIARPKRWKKRIQKIVNRKS